MRRLRAALVAGVLGAVAMPAGALGGGGATVFVQITSGVKNESTVYASIEVTGSVVVDFHGDAAAGCAARHLCDVTGSVRWDPSGSGSVTASGYRVHGKRFEEAFTALGFSDDKQLLRTFARVRREGVPGSLCADAAEEQFGEAHSGPRRGTSFVLRLLDLPTRTNAPGQVLQTRCAGPLTADVAGLLPGHLISERALRRGRRTLDFSADKPFAMHGLAGTLHSTVSVRLLGGNAVPSDATGGPSPRSRKHRLRQVEATYRVEKVSGRVVAALQGRSDPDLCGPLDACGISGSVSIAPAASSGSAVLSATGSARHSGAELRRALGIAAGPRPRGVSAGGQAFWRRDLGSIAADLTRQGAPACADTAPIEGGGTLNLGFGGGRVHASYEGGFLFAAADPFRTRCPGPTGDDLSGAPASGSFPLRVFRHRRVVLRLTRGHGFGAPGYVGRTRSDLTVVLRRTRLREFTFNEEIPSDFENGHVRSLR